MCHINSKVTVGDDIVFDFGFPVYSNVKIRVSSDLQNYPFICEFPMHIPIFYCNLCMVKCLDGQLAIKRRKIIAQATGVVATICAYTLFMYRPAGRTHHLSLMAL